MEMTHNPSAAIKKIATLQLPRPDFPMDRDRLLARLSRINGIEHKKAPNPN